MLTVVIPYLVFAFNLIELNNIFRYNTPPKGDKFLTFFYNKSIFCDNEMSHNLVFKNLASR